MHILDKIIAHKRKEVAHRKERYPVRLLEEQLHYSAPTVSMVHYLRRADKSGIIAEFKRRSPSKGDIHPHAGVVAVTIGYMQAGASGLSVLTDETFFGGSLNDLKQARLHNYCPILRKDFIIDEYQIVEARAWGADVVLLIAECLSAAEVARLAAFAKSLGLEVLLELHSADQLDKLSPEVDMVGVNNRNLKDFSVRIETSLELAERLPAEVVRISESGISNAAAIVRLKAAGYEGFLIGEHFMSAPDPAARCRQLVREIQRLETVPLTQNGAR